jgi:RNA polymerase sigma-70 factor (ECF subfamily)
MRAGEKLSDAELVLQILEGDDNAFSLLHSRYETCLLSYAFKRMGNQEDAQDIVQETFIEVAQHLQKLREPQKFANWMFGIASRLIAGRYRERQKQVDCISLSRCANETEASDVAAVLAHRHDEQQQELVDLQEMLAIAIGQLPDSERKPLLLQMSGMSHKEIAQALGIGNVAVNNRLARARNKLRSLVPENKNCQTT